MREVKEVVVATVSAAYREGLEVVARQFERQRPDIRVKIQILPGNGYETWLRAQITGDHKSGPDIFNANFAWGLYEKGLLANLSPALTQRNPWTGKPWRETLSAPFLEKAKIGGEVAYIPLDSIEIAFYYNQRLYQKMGFAPPRTWEEMLAQAQRFKDVGIIPFSVPGNADSYWSGTVGWVARFFSDAYQRHRVTEIVSQPGDWDYDPIKNAHFRLNLNDPYNDSLVVTNIERLLERVQSGALRCDDVRFWEMYQRIREFSRFWQPGFHGATSQTAYHLFLTGRAAVLLETSATVSQLLKDMNNLPERLRFPWGVFPVPPMKRTQFSLPPFRGVGGAGMSLAVVKKSETQVAASIDFLMCLASPQSAKILVEEAVKNGKPLTGPMLIPGAPIPEQIARHFRAFENRGFEKMSFRGLADEQESVWEWTVWAQRYMEDRITLDQFLARYQRLMQAAVPRVVALQKLDRNPHTKDAKG